MYSGFLRLIELNKFFVPRRYFGLVTGLIKLFTTFNTLCKSRARIYNNILPIVIMPAWSTIFFGRILWYVYVARLGEELLETFLQAIDRLAETSVGATNHGTIAHVLEHQADGSSEGRVADTIDDASEAARLTDNNR